MSRGACVKWLYRFCLSVSLLFLGGCDVPALSIGNSIQVVDLDAVAKATGRQELMQKELEFANLKLTEQLKLVASQLEENITDERDKLGKSPSKEQQQELEKLVLAAKQQLLNSKNLAIQQSTSFRSDLILDFRDDVAEISQEIANRSGGKLVLVSNYETIWFDSTIDIADEVIAVMRARGSNQMHSRNSNSGEAESSGEE